MGTVTKLLSIICACALSLAVFGEMGPAHCEQSETQAPFRVAPLPILIEHKGRAAKLERPPVPFNHDRHTKALKVVKMQDCAVCHVLKATDKQLVNPEVTVFKFPKASFDETDKTSIMYAYHNACVGCHKKRASEGKKAGPEIGQCGECHVRKPEARPVVWGWHPIFNYGGHAEHVQAAEKFHPADKLNVAQMVEIIGKTTGNNCEICHHLYDAKQKTLIFKKDSENSCRACHKTTDEKNARSMEKVAHAACIGCHMKLEDKVKKEAARQGRIRLTKQEKKQFGPFECRGCHGEHKTLTPEEIKKLPRLLRGQKDWTDVSLFKDPTKDAKSISMKLVPFDHKVHESTGQFCSTCHHHSLERCANCHTLLGDLKKGGGVPFEQAFHRISGNQSCLGCHNVATEDAKCAGCHRRQLASQTSCQGTCTVCHRGPSGGKPIVVAPLPVEFDKEKVPEKVTIKVLEKEFKPAEMPHQKILQKLTSISNENSLARFFHAAKDETLCYGCHHNTPQAAARKFPGCEACHSRPFNPEEPGRPGLMAAFHQQCTGCHKAMGQKPQPLDCEKCHAAKEAAKKLQVTIPLRGIPE